MLSAFAACLRGSLRITGEIPATAALAAHLLAGLAAGLVGLLAALRRLAAFLARLRCAFAVVGEISFIFGHSYPPVWFDCVNKTAGMRTGSQKNQYRKYMLGREMPYYHSEFLTICDNMIIIL
jgi:hypothetical protein